MIEGSGLVDVGLQWKGLEEMLHVGILDHISIVLEDDDLRKG